VTLGPVTATLTAGAAAALHDAFHVTAFRRASRWVRPPSATRSADDPS